ncbi:2Fe-2S iron-sulfur cluster-binding protein [Lentzea sp. BCCO 10_0061]|uniref:2Fe-2S iron-sulfur cluster-binding protein n=1 Tax=Lentzea sokolovensis TaxID=3095429 RepID=A0ABU4UPU2_9PSEU|nr:2Fe-2S iron-sulfur cluster-binding protein [Lentzea sp. BCCO 10_0061]MDX8140823.1 2Fe-2S iron-sulfur cluster-binding protein [Lentzea sp. BCCO 10_0061]
MPVVTVVPQDVQVRTRAGESVVDALRRHGWRSPYRCRRGGCGACRARLLSGRIRYPLPVAESVLTPAEQAAGQCLPCRAVPVTDVVLDIGAHPLRAVLASAPTPDPRPQEGL